MRYVVRNLRETRIYQEIKEEMYRKAEQKAKIKMITGLMAIGLTPEQIAQGLDMNLKVVRRVVRKNSASS